VTRQRLSGRNRLWSFIFPTPDFFHSVLSVYRTAPAFRWSADNFPVGSEQRFFRHAPALYPVGDVGIGSGLIVSLNLPLVTSSTSAPLLSQGVSQLVKNRDGIRNSDVHPSPPPWRNGPKVSILIHGCNGARVRDWRKTAPDKALKIFSGLSRAGPPLWKRRSRCRFASAQFPKCFMSATQLPSDGASRAHKRRFFADAMDSLLYQSGRTFAQSIIFFNN
jgi:hypothetical protein